MDVSGYQRRAWKVALCHVASILTVGLPLLLFHWKPHLEVKAKCRRCPLRQAEWVLIQDIFGQYFTTKIQAEQMDQSSLEHRRDDGGSSSIAVGVMEEGEEGQDTVGLHRKEEEEEEEILRTEPPRRPCEVLPQAAERRDESQRLSHAEWTPEGSGGNDAPGQYGAYFHDGGYLALPKHAFPRSLPDAPETIELEVRTNSAKGLILWQGVTTREVGHEPLAENKEEGGSGKAKDFISLGLKEGHLVFSYQLGSGEANIISEDPVDDGEWHRVTAVREGRKGFLQVDGEETVSGTSPGKHVMVNTKGPVYLGGAPDIGTLTAGKYTTGLTGCIKNVVLLNARPSHPPHQPVDLQHHSESGLNLGQCPS